MTIEVHGFCDPRCLKLKDALAANFDAGLELGASVALMRHGEPLADLWAGHADAARTRPWEKDTIVLLASTTKVAVILSLLMLVDRGLVDLDATVASYWPQFGAGGKARVTVREAMTHRAGVPGYTPPVTFESLDDWTATAANLAAQDHWFGGESQVCYHAGTYGVLLGEIIRRVDGRLPSRFFREEVAEKAAIDLRIGLRSEADQARAAEVASLDPQPPAPRHPIAERIVASAGSANTNSLEYRRGDRPSSNGYGNGRSVARLGAIFAGGGELDGVRYLSKAIVDEASRLQAEGDDPFFGPMRLGLGFGLDHAIFPAPSSTSFHWGGAGGSLICMDLRTGISFGYAMNNFIMTPDTAGEPRFQRLWGALGEVMATF
jgi:CubicO group peptidase (beta-lactamase class C family)